MIDPYATASASLDALRRGDVSSVELLEMHRRRVEAVDARINAVVARYFDVALTSAVDADRRRAKGEDALLLGLPFTVKDCLYVKGMTTTGGVPERSKAVADMDSVLVERLRGAGAVIFGKTNVPPYAADWQSDNPVYGRTLNPWSPDVTPGGSSGGSAAALATGMTPLEFGGDLAGSIRVPASFCGVYGHKSSETLLPRAGHFPGPPRGDNTAVGMGVQGPLARCADDLALALRVIAGPSEAEGRAWQLQPREPRAKSLRDCRVAVAELPQWLTIAGDVRAALERCADDLAHAGARVTRALPKGLGDLRDFHATYRSLLSCMEHFAAPAAMREQSVAELKASGGHDPFVAAQIAGAQASAAQYVEWHGRRAFYSAVMRAFFDDVDILLAPCAIVQPFPHTRHQPGIARTLQVDGNAVPYGMMFVLPSLCNLTGHPATAFPAGMNADGLPIGLQAIGPYLEDWTPIEFARLVEQERGGFRAPPAFT